MSSAAASRISRRLVGHPRRARNREAVASMKSSRWSVAVSGMGPWMPKGRRRSTGPVRPARRSHREDGVDDQDEGTAAARQTVDNGDRPQWAIAGQRVRG